MMLLRVSISLDFDEGVPNWEVVNVNVFFIHSQVRDPAKEV